MNKKNILALSIDENIFSKKSTNSIERQLEYSKGLNSITYFVLVKNHYEPIKIENCWFIPIRYSNVFSAYIKVIKFAKKLKKEGMKFEVITSQDPFFLGILGLRIAKIFNAKFKPQLHTQIFGSNFWKRESLLNRIQYVIAQYILNKADNVRVVNPKENQYLRKIGINSEFIPIYTDLKVDTELEKVFIPSKKTKKKYDLLFLGRLSHEKNLMFLLEVVLELKKKYPRITLAIGGNGKKEETIRRKILEFGLEKNVIMLGGIKYENISEFYSSGKIFILPSLYEGWGLVIIEAISFGIPIVMSNTGCAGEIVINNKSGVVCEVNNLGQFVSGIEKLLNKPELRTKYSKAAKKTAETKLNKKELIQKWVSFLND